MSTIDQRMPVAFAVAMALALALIPLADGGSAPTLGTPSGGQASGAAAAAADYGRLPLAFEPSRGRFGDGVDFRAATAAGSIALTDRGAALTRSDSEATLAMSVAGADLSRPAARDRLPGVVNDLRGDDPEAWRADIPTFGAVRYEGAYPGIDLDFRGAGSRLEYDFRLAPRADPARIALRYLGADSVRLTGNGGLAIEIGGERFRQRAPISFQPGPEGRTPVESTFAVDGRKVSFELGDYDRSRRLVIDPLVLEYSTYLGGGVLDESYSIDVDSSGSAYITGSTTSADFDTVGQYESDGGDFTNDAFVTKLNPAGNALVYSTYLGGSGYDVANAIEVDAAGSAYVVGETQSVNFDTQGPIESDADGATSDAFLTKLTPAGNALAYSTYLGGTAADQALDVAVDAVGAAYLTGFTLSSDFDTVGAIEPQTGAGDMFLSKVNPAGSALVYSTYLGGGGADVPAGVDVDSSGAAYVAGYTTSVDYDAVGAYEADADGAADDAILTKVNPAGSAIAYSTYLGGNGIDNATDIAVDSAGSAYVTGYTESPDFDTVGPIESDADGALEDAFVTKFAPAGNALTYSTYLGGSDSDRALAIDVGSDGSAYVAGGTTSVDFDVLEPYEADGGDATFDAFVSKLTPAGSAITWSTYVGGAAVDSINGIAVDPSGSAYFAGSTDSTDFDTVNPVEGDGGDANTDAVVGKLTLPGVDPPAPPAPPAPPTPDAALPEPIQGKTVNATPVSGTVLVKPPGASGFIELADAESLPTGTVFDLRKGKVSITSSAEGDSTRTADFYAGLVKVLQSAKDGAETEVKLVGKLEGCKKKGKGGNGGKSGKRRVTRRGGIPNLKGRGVWGKGGKGHKSSGGKSSGSVRGTWWLVQDTCDKRTKTFVKEGKVWVRDFKRKRTVVVKQGKTYYAPGPKRPK